MSENNTNDNQVKTPYTRFMAYVAFFFVLLLIWFKPESVTDSILIFFGVVIGYWQLGRATMGELIEALKVKWGR